jgi:hypothetical protein
MTLERRDNGFSLSHLVRASATLWAMLERAVVTLVTGLSVASLAGCGSKEQVMLSASLEDAMLIVDATALTTELTGSFDLVLTLGDRAADPTTVGLGTFSLQRDGQVLLSPLEMDESPDLPMTIGVGKTERIAVSIMGSVGEPELAADLCAGELSIIGTVTDSLVDDRPRTLSSGPFPPDCP